MIHQEMHVRKRDGRLVSFERERISRAIASAFRAELEIPKGEALKPDLEHVSVGLRASRQPETSIFLLTAEGAEPNYTQEFLDASIQEYMSFRKEMRSQTSESTLLKITEELLRLEEEMVQAGPQTSS